MQGLLRSLLIVAAITFVVWLVGALLGFDLALLPSLLVSVVLTALLNLPSALRSRSRS